MLLPSLKINDFLVADPSNSFSDALMYQGETHAAFINGPTTKRRGGITALSYKQIIGLDLDNT